MKIHFIGIGGIGMSSLAQYFLAKGWRVSGSDLVGSEITEQLKKIGCEIFVGHRALNILEKVDRVIFSAAVKEDNPELEQAKNLNIEIISYAQALGELTRQYITIAVSGAHGKSTTTALLALMLIKGGLDPTVIIGTRLKEFGPPGGGNFRFGKSRYLVVEADEYNKSFLHYYPTVAVITNIDKEHLDTYGDLSGVINTFAQYFNNIANVGALIVNSKDENIESALKIWEAVKKNKGGPKIIKYKTAYWSIKIPGQFNQLNCEAAWQAAKLFGVTKLIAEAAVKNYSGSWRRMEELTPKRVALRQAQSQRFYSDYAHHPTEIKATIKAVKELFPKKKLVVVFQPHQLERLNNLFDDFVSAFNECDELILMPTYQVAGREMGARKDSKDLAKAIEKLKLVSVSHIKSFESIVKKTKQMPNSVILFMGAGDIDTQARKYFKSKLL